MLPLQKGNFLGLQHAHRQHRKQKTFNGRTKSNECRGI